MPRESICPCKRVLQTMDDKQNLLATIPGEIIAKAAMRLPEAETTPDEPHFVQMPHKRRWHRITFKRFKMIMGRTHF